MAEIESMIKPDGILNDFRGKPVAFSSRNHPDALNLSVAFFIYVARKSPTEVGLFFLLAE
jgi:hypothetical protein